MKNQYLFNNLQQALDHKQNIINNRGSYTHQVAVTVRHKERFVSFLKWKYDEWDETHYETRFDQSRFDQDLSAADQKINDCNTAIDTHINDFKQELVSLSSQNAAEASKISQLGSMISEYRQQQYQFASSHNQLKSFIDRCHGNSNYSSGQISSQENELYRIANQIGSVKSQTENNQSQIQNLTDRISFIRESLEETHRTTFDFLNTLDNSKRAALIIDLFGGQGSDHVIDMIIRIGFDANELAYRAVERDNIEVFKLALSSGANCASYMVEGQTILQKLFIESKENFIAQVLSENINLENCILNSIKNDDQVSFDRLLSYDHSYIHKLIHGYSVLHISICAQNPELVHSIIARDSSSIGISNSRGESTMKIALRSSTDQIIIELSRYVDLNTQCNQLIEDRDTLLFDKLISIVGAHNLQMESLLAYALKCSALEIASHIMHQGVSPSEIFKAAMLDNDQVTINNIMKINYDLYENLLAENAEMNLSGQESEYQVQPY